MTAVHLPFNGQNLVFDVPDRNLAAVMHPAPAQPLADLDDAIAKALNAPMGQPPLSDWVRPTDKVLIVSDDNTRLTPVDHLLPPLVEKLNQAGVPDGNIRVIMDANGRVVGIFFGDMRVAFRHGVVLAREIYGIPYRETPDIVIANSCPADLDFWQSHKSLYPAARMVKPGGTIIVTTPCPLRFNRSTFV